MKCLECAKAGKDGWLSLRYDAPTFEKEGENVSEYECSNGHLWEEKYYDDIEVQNEMP